MYNNEIARNLKRFVSFFTFTAASYKDDCFGSSKNKLESSELYFLLYTSEKYGLMNEFTMIKCDFIAMAAKLLFMSSLPFYFITDKRKFFVKALINHWIILYVPVINLCNETF